MTFEAIVVSRSCFCLTKVYGRLAGKRVEESKYRENDTPSSRDGVCKQQITHSTSSKLLKAVSRLLPEGSEIVFISSR